MTKYLLILLTLTVLSGHAQQSWKPTATPLFTRWAADVDPAKPLPEYPRPQMVRKNWINLNGLWKYAISSVDAATPDQWQGDILVPFCIESALSGVGKRVSETEKLWYQRTVSIPAAWKKHRILLHFEAVDWETEVWVDGHSTGIHQGGYDPFDFDITDWALPGKEHILTVSVRDPTDKSFINPRGKQVSNPGGIFYTPVTGIWQTVWLEAVPQSYIRDFKVRSDIQTGKVYFETDIANLSPATEVAVRIFQKKGAPVVKKATGGQPFSLTIPEPSLWSPESPYLYAFEMTLTTKGQKKDRITGYLGMREIKIGTVDGYACILLNGKPVFQNGPLDQGYWPDGIYTAPTDEALRFDIATVSDMGFNMLRKHVKVESRRFYYWCDKKGILVWQDMPSTSGNVDPGEPDLTVNSEHLSHFRRELQQMIRTHYNHPSIIMWVVFNEGWGQHDTKETVDFVRSCDFTRLISNASGWEDRRCGDIMDIHHYPEPAAPAPETARATVLGEYGGLGLPVSGHTWQKENWGYQSMQHREQLLETYEHYISDVYRFRDKEYLSACVYTQLTDVETETNGLLTYDRAVFKITTAEARQIHQGYRAPQFAASPDIFIDGMTCSFEKMSPGISIFFTTDGTEPTTASALYTGPIEIRESCTVKAIACSPASGDQPPYTSRIVERHFEKTFPMPGLMFIRQPDVALSALRYEGEWDVLPDFNALQPVEKGFSSKIGLEDVIKKDLIGLSYRGYITIPRTGIYTFYVTSDDGSRLRINKQVIVDNDGLHGPREKWGYAALQAGYHEFRLDFFEKRGGEHLKIMIEGPDLLKQEIPGSWFYH